LYLSRFNFILKHVSRKSIERADGLSQRLDWKVGMEKNDEDRKLIEPEWLMVKATEKEEVLIKEIDVLENIRKLKIRDNKMMKAVEEMKKIRVKVLWDKKWRKEEELLLKGEKVYVPKDRELRTKIIYLHHNILVAGHERQ